MGGLSLFANLRIFSQADKKDSPSKILTCLVPYPWLLLLRGAEQCSLHKDKQDAGNNSLSTRVTRMRLRCSGCGRDPQPDPAWAGARRGYACQVLGARPLSFAQPSLSVALGCGAQDPSEAVSTSRSAERDRERARFCPIGQDLITSATILIQEQDLLHLLWELVPLDLSCGSLSSHFVILLSCFVILSLLSY